MPKRLSRRHTSGDANQSAFRIVQALSERSEPEQPSRTPKKVVSIAAHHRNNSAAVALGRKGGMKSAQGRMEKIAPEERRRIASNAARARWAKKRGDG